MRLSHVARKRLSSAQALRQTAEQLFETVRDLDQQLGELKCSTEAILPLDGSFNSSNLPENINLRQALSIQYAYLCLVLDIHTPLANPWFGTSIKAKEGTPDFAQIERSCATVAQASRDAILLARHIDVNATCPSL